MSTDNHTPEPIEIPLTRGLVAIVDAIDGDLAQLKWSANQSGYAQHGIAKGKYKRGIARMHRMILERMLGRSIITSEEVDHINSNRIDNRRSNLRLATSGENSRNQRRSKSNTTGYKGVSIVHNCPNRPFRARIVINGKEKHLGFFATAEEAHTAYCEGAKKYHGEFARF